MPGRRILLDEAPALRMAVTAAWTVEAQVVMSRSCWRGLVRGWMNETDWGKAYRLVHYAKSDFRVALVLRCELGPETRELRIGRPALTNDSSVPAGVIVDIDDTQRGASVQAALHKLVVVTGVGRVQVPAQLAVDEVLPANRKTESVEVVVLDEMRHLVITGLAGWVGFGDGASPVCPTAEVETSDVDTCVWNAAAGGAAGGGRGGRWFGCGWLGGGRRFLCLCAGLSRDGCVCRSRAYCGSRFRGRLLGVGGGSGNALSVVWVGCYACVARDTARALVPALTAA